MSRIALGLAHETRSGLAGKTPRDKEVVINTTDNSLYIGDGSAVNGVMHLESSPDPNYEWVAWTPTINATSNSFTSVAAAGLYKKIGKRCYIKLKIVITTNGTAAGQIESTLPFNSVNGGVSNGGESFIGREIAVIGKLLTGSCKSSTKLGIQFYDNTYPGADGYQLCLNGFYEVA